MKRTTINLQWSEKELKIKYTTVIGVTIYICYNNVPFV